MRRDAALRLQKSLVQSALSSSTGKARMRPSTAHTGCACPDIGPEEQIEAAQLLSGQGFTRFVNHSP